MPKRTNSVAALSVVMTVLTACDGAGSGWPARVEWEAPPSRPPSIRVAGTAGDACLMPVRDGKPTSADVGQAFRMVGSARTFAEFNRPWFGPLNRRGQWTIDEDGRYVVFPGPDVRQLFDVVTIFEERRSRIVAASDGMLWVLDRKNAVFVPLARVGARTESPNLLRAERLDLTLAIMPGRVLRLRGDKTEPWLESDEVVDSRTAAAQAFDLPGMKALLFLTEAGDIRVRRDDGRWLTLEPQRDAPRFEWIEQVHSSTNGRTVLLRLHSERGPVTRHLAIMASVDLSSFTLVDPGSIDDDTSRLVYLEATDEVLRFKQASPLEGPEWSRLTLTGFEPVSQIAPERNGNFLFFAPTMIARRKAMVFPTASGLAIYEKGRMREVATTGEGLGHLPAVVDLPSVGRTLIQSENGLFELTEDNRAVRVEAPFSTGGLPAPLVFDDAADGRAVFFAAEGQFVLGKDGQFRSFLNSHAATPAFSEGRVLEMPLSGDDLLIHQNSLWLVVSPRSDRWEACRAYARDNHSRQTAGNGS